MLFDFVFINLIRLMFVRLVVWEMELNHFPRSEPIGHYHYVQASDNPCSSVTHANYLLDRRIVPRECGAQGMGRFGGTRQEHEDGD